MKDWRDISYLKNGDSRQRDVFAAIKSCKLLEMLTPFDPVLAGTYPLGIYLPESDVDIICCFENADAFLEILQSSFSLFHNFETNTKTIREVQSVIGRFKHAGFLFEIFGQAVPVENQYAYRHMLIEDQLLHNYGLNFREEIIKLKSSGNTTEEAFAILLGIEGDPYEGLLGYGNAS